MILVPSGATAAVNSPRSGGMSSRRSVSSMATRSATPAARPPRIRAAYVARCLAGFIRGLPGDQALDVSPNTLGSARARTTAARRINWPPPLPSGMCHRTVERSDYHAPSKVVTTRARRSSRVLAGLG